MQPGIGLHGVEDPWNLIELPARKTFLFGEDHVLTILEISGVLRVRNAKNSLTRKICDRH